MIIGLYTFAAVVGGALLLISIFAGHGDVDADADHDFDFDVDVDADVDVDMDMDADVDADVDADADADAHADHDHDLSHDAASTFSGADFFTIFLSLRFWTFFLVFGGAIGLVLSLLGFSTVGTALFAAIGGLLCGGIGAGVVRYLQRDDVDSAVRARDLVGKSARVTVRVHADRPGKVKIEFADHVREVLAISDGPSLEVGEEVLVIHIEEGGVARVTSKKPALDKAREEEAQKRAQRAQAQKVK